MSARNQRSGKSRESAASPSRSAAPQGRRPTGVFMTILKVGIPALVAAGAVALAIARSGGAEGGSPPAALPEPVATVAAADPHAGHNHPPPAAPANQAPVPGTPVATDGSGPQAEVPELIFDAGTVERGTDITHSFTIKNTGRQDLTVDAKPG